MKEQMQATNSEMHKMVTACSYGYEMLVNYGALLNHGPASTMES